MPSIAGGVVEGGRSMSGIVSAADMTGGGLVTVCYKQVSLGNTDPARLRYWSQLAAILNGGVRSIRVPLVTDFIAPLDWSAAVTVAAALNASTLTFIVYGKFLTDPGMTGGEWFGLVHPNKDVRAYVVTEVDTVVTNPDESITYTVGIRPPLREAVAYAAPLSFYRPQCLMRLAPGTTISADVDKSWWATPDVSFVESFGTF